MPWIKFKRYFHLVVGVNCDNVGDEEEVSHASGDLHAAF